MNSHVLLINTEISANTPLTFVIGASGKKHGKSIFRRGLGYLGIKGISYGHVAKLTVEQYEAGAVDISMASHRRGNRWIAKFVVEEDAPAATEVPPSGPMVPVVPPLEDPTDPLTQAKIDDPEVLATVERRRSILDAKTNRLTIAHSMPWFAAVKEARLEGLNPDDFQGEGRKTRMIDATNARRAEKLATV